MKANRKFLKNADEAVSPVIAVILMVAITVVLAATVYVWVSGFSGSGSSPAKTLALTSAGPIDSSTTKTYTVASGSPGMRWSDLTVTVDGTPYTISATACGTPPAAASTYQPCGPTLEAGSALVNAGDTIRIYGAAAGQTLRILDAQANSVMLTLTIG